MSGLEALQLMIAYSFAPAVALFLIALACVFISARYFPSKKKGRGTSYGGPR
jgi:hypothetical protein